MTEKEEVIEVIKQLPYDVTLAEVIEILKVRFQVEDGLRELDAGLGIPHAEAMERTAKWLNQSDKS